MVKEAVDKCCKNLYSLSKYILRHMVDSDLISTRSLDRYVDQLFYKNHSGSRAGNQLALPSVATPDTMIFMNEKSNHGSKGKQTQEQKGTKQQNSRNQKDPGNKKNDNDNSVYKSVDENGKTDYVGITNNVERIAHEHFREKGIY